jgi:glycosyltransferase involved in cell wall biosynthesis
MMSSDRIAIVVPAWKPNYLKQALHSIGSQTADPCDVYIFDDAGPSEIATISREFPKFKYYRFDENLGKSALVAHWNRCLHRVPNEWVWLFSDDDVMCPGSIGAIQRAIRQQPNAAVLQLSVKMVNADLSKTIWTSRPPDLEPASDYLIARLAGRRLSCLPDHVFSWKRLRELNSGLYDFPLAWNSDDATWLALASGGGLLGVPDAEVLWRQSDLNISGDLSQRWTKLNADLRFIDFLVERKLMSPQIRALSRHWLGRRLTDIYGFALTDIAGLWAVLPGEFLSILPKAAARMLLKPKRMNAA